MNVPFATRRRLVEWAFVAGAAALAGLAAFTVFAWVLQIRSDAARTVLLEQVVQLLARLCHALAARC